MTKLGSAKPIETWKSWPHGKLRKGDVVTVFWCYEGIHGATYAEDNYLLLECIMKNDQIENWSTMIIGGGEISGQQYSGSFLEHIIYSRDFDNETFEDWQRVALMMRADIEE